MHRKGRCVFHIAELDSCRCEKYVMDEQSPTELTLKERN
jgi:hypothetical protein